MKITPVNNWIYIDLDKKEEKEDSLVLLPEDYKVSESVFKAVTVLCSSVDDFDPSDRIIVPTHTIQDIQIDDQTLHMVLNNHVMAVVK